MKDIDHPFFRPLWRRVALVVMCVAWAAMEFYGGSRNWSMIALGFAAYAAWQFLWMYKPPADDEPEQTLPKE
jgi:hypothetical protein